MNSLSLHLPIERYSHSPELASLAILEAALGSCEIALLASHPEMAYGVLDNCPRGSSVMRAHSILVAGHRLAAALVAYRLALGRDERLARKSRDSDIPF